MSDEPAYGKYPRKVLWGIVGAFAASIALASFLLYIALYFADKTGLPNWVVPAGILVGAISSVASAWNLVPSLTRSHQFRTGLYTAGIALSYLVWHWLSPHQGSGIFAFVAITTAYGLGVYISTWAQLMGSLPKAK